MGRWYMFDKVVFYQRAWKDSIYGLQRRFDIEPFDKQRYLDIDDDGYRDVSRDRGRYDGDESFGGERRREASFDSPRRSDRSFDSPRYGDRDFDQDRYRGRDVDRDRYADRNYDQRD